jgi:hypothetical protein
MDACCRTTAVFQGEPSAATAGRTIRVANGAVRSIRPPAGTVLRCAAGIAWLTHAGQDVVLPAGQSYAVKRRGTLVLQSLTAAGAVVVVER